MKKILLLADRYLKLATQLSLFGPKENKEISAENKEDIEETVSPEISIPALKELEMSTVPKRKKINKHKEKLHRLNQNSRTETFKYDTFSFNSQESIENFKLKIKDLARLVHDNCHIYLLGEEMKKIKQDFDDMKNGDKKNFYLIIQKSVIGDYGEKVVDTKYQIKLTIAKKDKNNFKAEALFLDNIYGEKI